MNSLRTSLRAAVALALLGSASLALAGSPYDVRPLDGTGQALGPNGQIFGVGSNGNLYLTGANGVGSTNLGDVAGGYYGHTNAFSSPSWSDWWNVAPSNWTYGGGPVNAPASVAGLNGNPYFTPIPTAVAVNGSGVIAANLNFPGSEDAPYENNVGAVRYADGSVTYLGSGTTVAGLNAAGTVVYSGAPVQTYTGAQFTSGWRVTTTAGAITTLAAGSTTPVAVQDLGFGGIAGGINKTGQVTGGLNTEALTTGTYDPTSWGFNTTWPSNTIGSDSNGNPLVPSKAFRTGANGVGETVFGTGAGVSSMGLAINDAGQVGGYFTLASGQTQGFITSAHGTALVGIGVGASGDSTQVDFLNNLGQAIVQDTTTNAWYFYNAGVLTNVANLASNLPAGDPVVGLNDLGQILLADPYLLSVLDTSQLTVGSLLSNYGGVDVTTTQAFIDTATATGLAPTATFFHHATSSDDSSFQVYEPNTFASPVTAPEPTGSVPEPGVLGLLVAGAALLVAARRKDYGIKGRLTA